MQPDSHRIPQPSHARELVIVTAVFAVLTFVMALPFSLSPGSRLLADVPDAHMFLWTLGWDVHAFLEQPLRIFDANIYHPYANTLAYSENLIGSAFFAAPIVWLTGNVVLATNLVALMTCALCGAGAYFLGRRLNMSVGAAMICGVVFAFAPPRFIRMGQLHLTAVQWIPFALAFLHTYFERGTRRDLLLALAFFSLQALTSGHGATYLFVTIACFLIWRFAFGEPLAIGRRLRDFGVAGAYLLAPAVLIMLPYRVAQAEAGLKGGYLSDVHPRLESFLATPSRLYTYLRTAWFGAFEREPDAFLFPGLLVLALAAIAVVRVNRDGRLRDNRTAFYLLIAVVATLMFVERPFEVWRYVHGWPGFSFIRIPSRFVILTMLALAVLAGIGFDRLVMRASRTTRMISSLVVGALLLGEAAVYPMSGVPFDLNVPAIDRWLATQPKPFVFAEVPVPSPEDMGALERQQTQVMRHAMTHWQKTIHGYSSLRRPLHDQLYKELAEFPDPPSVDSLRELGVNFIVVHTDDYGSRWPSVEEEIAHTPALKLEHVEGAGRVYSILPP
jgi:hypothetical protein